jgi:hypothetical protein
MKCSCSAPAAPAMSASSSMLTERSGSSDSSADSSAARSPRSSTSSAAPTGTNGARLRNEKKSASSLTQLVRAMRLSSPLCLTSTEWASTSSVAPGAVVRTSSQPSPVPLARRVTNTLATPCFATRTVFFA